MGGSSAVLPNVCPNRALGGHIGDEKAGALPERLPAIIELGRGTSASI